MNAYKSTCPIAIEPIQGIVEGSYDLPVERELRHRVDRAGSF